MSETVKKKRIFGPRRDKCKCGKEKDKRSGLCRDCRFAVRDEKHKCTKCGKNNKQTKFRIRVRATIVEPAERPRSWCMECESKCSREYRKKTPRAILNERSRSWERKNPDTVKLMYFRRRARVAGVSEYDLDRVVKLAMVATRCDICERDVAEVGTLCFDHCHNTGIFRGLICSPCNFGLGQFGDNANRLRSAISYLGRTVEKVTPATPNLNGATNDSAK